METADTAGGTGVWKGDGPLRGQLSPPRAAAAR